VLMSSDSSKTCTPLVMGAMAEAVQGIHPMCQHKAAGGPWQGSNAIGLCADLMSAA